jgi:hypothetical protein
MFTLMGIFITNFFKKKSSDNSLFSLALNEAVKDTFEEMGYDFYKTLKKEPQSCYPQQK